MKIEIAELEAPADVSEGPIHPPRNGQILAQFVAQFTETPWHDAANALPRRQLGAA